MTVAQQAAASETPAFCQIGLFRGSDQRMLSESLAVCSIELTSRPLSSPDCSFSHSILPHSLPSHHFDLFSLLPFSVSSANDMINI
jgi:hypothetical protein